MRAAIECIFENEVINIHDALSLRENLGRKLYFSCTECNQELRAHRAGKNTVAHFEHLQRNKSCSFSASATPAYTGSGILSVYGIEDIRAIEGYEIDKKLISHGRNSKLVILCKERDKHTCRACGFQLELNGKFVIECHHTKPVALNGEREVSLSELICLCPTCHRIAHTRSEPLAILEIRQARKLT